MRMNERFTFRHRDTDKALACPLFAVVSNHSYMTAVPNRHRDDSPLSQRRFCSLMCGLGDKWTQAILSVHAQDGIGSPDVPGIDIHKDKAFLDASRQDGQALQSVRVMSA